MRALVIDNDEAMQKLVLRLLDREGWTGITAADDREAFAAFRVGWFDLAIIDVDLDAGSDGIELAKILRKLDPALPIVMISGDPFNAARVKKARLHHFFAKPFQIESISSVLRAIARRT
jgi:DNA-binding response OmpR family regulator